MQACIESLSRGGAVDNPIYEHSGPLRFELQLPQALTDENYAYLHGAGPGRNEGWGFVQPQTRAPLCGSFLS